MNVRPFLRGLAYVANDVLAAVWPAPAVGRAVDAFAWPEALTEVEAEVDHLEPGELNHRFYCNRCGGGYYTGQHNCLRDNAERREALGPYTADSQRYNGHDPRDPYCEYDIWDEGLPCADVRCQVCSPLPTDVPGVPPAPGNDPAGVEQPPVPPAGIDYDRLAGGPW